MLAIGYVFYNEGPTFLQFNPPNSDTLPLDIMLVNDETFAKFQAEAVPVSSNIPQAKMVSLLHLLALKCHAIKHGHKGRVEKDVDDVLGLIRVNQVNPDDPELRELVLKFGTKVLHEKIRKSCGQR